MSDKTALGISEELHQFIEALVEKVVLEGDSFENHKKYLLRFCLEEGVDYNLLEFNLSELFKTAKKLKGHESTEKECSLRLLAKEIYLTPDEIEIIISEIKTKRHAEETARLKQEVEERERKAREEAERRAREEQERRAREEAERHAKEERERKAREEAERRAREERERKAREEAERRAREEQEHRAREEAERHAKEERERKAREEAERRAREEQERKVREEAERKATIEYNRTLLEEMPFTDFPVIQKELMSVIELETFYENYYWGYKSTLSKIKDISIKISDLLTDEVFKSSTEYNNYSSIANDFFTRSKYVHCNELDATNMEGEKLLITGQNIRSSVIIIREKENHNILVKDNKRKATIGTVIVITIFISIFWLVILSSYSDRLSVLEKIGGLICFGITSGLVIAMLWSHDFIDK